MLLFGFPAFDEYFDSNHSLSQQDKPLLYYFLGDAKTQLSQVKEFGYGEPILLDRDGNKDF